MKNKFFPLCLCGITAFGMMTFAGCDKGEDVQVYAPDGAPALALAKLLEEDRADDGISYTVTSSTKITTFVTGRKPKADVCIMPVNLASLLLGSGDDYQMVGLATHGNMYLLSADDTTYTRENIQELQGKKMGVVQLANVPGLVLRAALTDLGVAYSTASVTMDGVYLKGVSPMEIRPNGGEDVYLCPEPAASVKIKAFAAQGKTMYMVGDLQQLYGEEDGYPQACVVAKKSFIEKNPEKFARIMDGISHSKSYLSAADISSICDAVSSHLEDGLAATFSSQNLTREVIERCNVRFEKSEICKEKVDRFLQKIKAVSGDSAQAVDEKFYYIGD